MKTSPLAALLAGFATLVFPLSDSFAEAATRVETRGVVSDVREGGGRVILRTPTGDREVALAPAWFLTQNNMDIAIGDTLVVQGLENDASPVARGASGTLAKPSIAATRIQRNGQFLRLRDENGRAAWTGGAYSSRNFRVDPFE